MHKRKFIIALGFLLTSFIPIELISQPSVSPTKKNLSKEFSELAMEYENKLLQHNPELGMFWGRKDIILDKFMDYSLKEVMSWERQENDFLIALRHLEVKPAPGTPEYYTYNLLKETLENKKASRQCKLELWNVNPAFGWHNNMVIVAQRQPVGTPTYRQLALKRWRTFEQVVNAQIKNLKIGLREGYTAPKPAVDRVIAQLKMMVSADATQSPFFDFAKRDGDERFKDQVKDIIYDTINPSLQRYIHFLEHDYRPYAREAIGVSALPSGVTCYQAKIKEETTLNMSPQQIHDFGLEYMNKLAAEVAEIGQRKYGNTDMATIFHLAKIESENYFASEQDIINYNVAALERVKLKAPLWFGLIPKAQGTLKPYPPHRAQTGASGEYYPPSEDGDTPGVFFINTYQPEKRSRIDQEATLFHELIPGHHFQVATLYENKDIPKVNRYLLNSGYGEGWALYTERLADEMGLYVDDISRLGMLSNEALRAARLVVDTGIHVLHWRREEAVEYLIKHTALNANIIEGEVDRYIMSPGQATAYMLGKAEIESLRALAKERLGERFDIKQFHHQVLKNGFISLSLLREHINRWLENMPS